MTSSPDAYSYSALSYSGPHTREELDKLRQDLVKLFYPKASENYTWQQWQEVLAEVHSRKDLIPGDRWITSKLVDEMSSVRPPIAERRRGAGGAAESGRQHAFTEADALQPRDGRLGFKEFVRYASAGVDEIATHINFEEISHPDPTGAADAAGHGDYDQSGPEPSPPPAPAPAPALAPAPEAAPAPAEDEEEVGAEGDEGEEKREGDDENGRPWLVEPTDERLPTEHAPSPTGHGQIHLRAGPASLYDAADEAEGAEESGAGGDPAVDGFFGL